MAGPTHDPDTCTWKAGQWECLHALDADHFYLGDFLVDLVTLRYALESLNGQARSDQWWDIHERNRTIGNLRRRAEALVAGKEVKPDWIDYVKKNLLVANQHGLHTGYPPWIPSKS